uniref:hypothetical protein n=1 Tax=Flavobacterium sp. TaxID=239 RepID=UPI0040495C99
MNDAGEVSPYVLAKTSANVAKKMFVLGQLMTAEEAFQNFAGISPEIHQNSPDLHRNLTRNRRIFTGISPEFRQNIESEHL